MIRCHPFFLSLAAHRRGITFNSKHKPMSLPHYTCFLTQSAFLSFLTCQIVQPQKTALHPIELKRSASKPEVNQSFACLDVALFVFAQLFAACWSHTEVCAGAVCVNCR